MPGNLGPAVSRRSLMKLGGAGLAAAGLGSLAGCSGSSKEGSPSTEKATLKWIYFGPQTSATALQKTLEPKIQAIDKSASLVVTGVNGTDWNDFIAKVLTMIASGDVPDIVGIATEGTQLMAEKDLIMPLDDYVKKDMSGLKEYFDDVHPALVEAMMYKGSLFSMPDNFNAGSMFYSTSLFEKAGLQRPADNWTVDDFHSYAQKLAGLGGQTNAFDWVVRLWGSWTSFMYANNANLLEAGKYSGGDWLWKSDAYSGNALAAGRAGGWNWGAPTANSPDTVEALDFVVQMQKSGLSPSPDVGGGGTLQGLFASGRIGMTIGGGFWAGGLHNAGMPKGSFDVSLFPTWKSNRSLFGTGGCAIFQKSKHKDLAWEVCKMIIDKSTFPIMNPGATTTPPRKSLLTADMYKDTGPEHFHVFYDQLNNSMPIPAPPYYNALATALNQRTTQAISSGNAKAALDGMQSDLEKAAAGA